MNTIPIILTFDNNMSLPAAVCISSMMMSAKEDTFYDFYVLHAGEPPHIVGLEKIKAAYPNMRLQYRSVGDAFSGAFEIRGITEAAYYRLLAAELVPEYDKVIYTDVDVIFRMDLVKLFLTELGDNYFGAVYAPGIANCIKGKQYLSSIGFQGTDYVCSGFLLMNLRKIREDNYTQKFKYLADNKYRYQDQDVINVACQGKIILLPRYVSMGVSDFYDMVINECDFSDDHYTNVEILKFSNIHFNGVKPWRDSCPNFDQWWECYRKSPLFDEQFYFKFFYNKLESLDKLSLLKRIKILIRYFVYGRKKDI